MTGRPKGKKNGEGAGCLNAGHCESCPYEDCVATAYECTTFYKAEEEATRRRYSLKAIRGKLNFEKEEAQRLAHNARCREYHKQKRMMENDNRRSERLDRQPDCTIERVEEAIV